MAQKPKSRGLGRGLEALFADRAEIAPKERPAPSEEASPDGVRYVDINDIKPNRDQPRKIFDEEKLDELALSILDHGIIQPLVVRASGNTYELVAGERRWRAARKAGLKTVPCLVRDFTDEENMLVAIIENMQREDLDPIEEAEGLEKMIKTYGLTQEQVSKSVSKSRPYISNALRLLNLPEEIRRMISEGVLTAGHARAILAIEGEARQIEAAKKVANEGLSVREAERLSGLGSSKRKKSLKRVKNREILSVEQELTDILGTRVSINAKGKGGALEIEYFSTDELNRLIDLLKTVRG